MRAWSQVGTIPCIGHAVAATRKPRAVSAESIERRREGILRRLAEGPVVREVLRESFPNAIQLQPDESGKHLRAVFVYEEGATRNTS